MPMYKKQLVNKENLVSRKKQLIKEADELEKKLFPSPLITVDSDWMKNYEKFNQLNLKIKTVQSRIDNINVKHGGLDVIYLPKTIRK